MLVAWGIIFATCRSDLFAQSVTHAPANGIVRIVEIQGSVEILPSGDTNWILAHPNGILKPFDRIHTEDNSRVALRWSNQSVVQFGPASQLQILPANSSDDEPGIYLVRGIISFFHRDKPGSIRISTRGALAGVEGTELVLAVDNADKTTLSVLDGKVKFGNRRATLLLTNGEQAVVELGQAPVRSAGFIANNLLQWCFYYPAVIDPDELQLTAIEEKNLANSLAAYRAGDLQMALAKFSNASDDSNSVKIYHAALLLSVGEVEKSETILASLSKNSDRIKRLADSLKQLISAVKQQPAATSTEPKLASEFLADSYFEQSRAIREISLQNALRFAKQAASISPNFGFAWERVAELEFSFGQTHIALADLDKSLALSPQNAQALALKGFILSADDNPHEALDWFDRAIAADSSLGNAWLGRGIVRIRLGNLKGGREDLLIAAAREPQRAELRSYLGKSYQATGDIAHAAKELALAKRLDPSDPTAWLYSSLLEQQENQINDAIRDLEKSQSLNDNRSVYRSQLLLDEDRAMRSANLASIYRDAGMFDWSLNEAGRAVSSDYANYSAHLFLANSYDQLRDPNWSNLRYETPASDEFWIANLLAPTGAGWMSSAISEQPYAKLFDQNRFGAVSDTTYLSRGAWTENAEHFYNSGNFSYDVGTSYLYDPGQRPNNDNEQREIDISLKGQLSPQDSLFGSIQLDKINSGDVNEYYNQSAASPDLLLNETQEPNLFLGYHHEWSPGVHTLFFATRQVADESAYTTNAAQYIGAYYNGGFGAVRYFGNGENAEIDTKEYSTELQQIWEQANHTTVIGTRYEWGDINYQNFEWNTDMSGYAATLFPNPNALINQNFTLDYHHFQIYGYHTWQIADPLSLTVGLSYDSLQQPADVATTPFVDQEKTASQISPKAGFIWTPIAGTTLRAAYTRSLSGLGGGQNDQLEPTEVAGFNQAYRSLIPESAVGDTSGSRFDTYNISLEQKFQTGTYLTLSGEILYSKLTELQGDFVHVLDPALHFSTYPLGLNESLDYRERSIALNINQLLGKQWTIGAQYRLSQADLKADYVNIPASLPVSQYSPSFQARQNLDSVLQTVNLQANWNHPSGLFARFEGNWYHQENSGFTPAEPGDDFWQINAYAGYRFWHRKAEVTIGLLNITGQNYQLEPLNLYNERPRSRTFYVRLLISF
jgi:Tfp pilus assembly protein PilF